MNNNNMHPSRTTLRRQSATYSSSTEPLEIAKGNLKKLNRRLDNMILRKERISPEFVALIKSADQEVKRLKRSGGIISRNGPPPVLPPPPELFAPPAAATDGGRSGGRRAAAGKNSKQSKKRNSKRSTRSKRSSRLSRR